MAQPSASATAELQFFFEIFRFVHGCSGSTYSELSFRPGFWQSGVVASGDANADEGRLRPPLDAELTRLPESCSRADPLPTRLGTTGRRTFPKGTTPANPG